MPRKPKPAPVDEPATAEPDPTFAEIWDAIEPGARMSRGAYSVWKTREGGLLVSYRPDGADSDQHLPFPPAMVAAMIAASQGKGPFGRLRAMTAGMMG